MSISAQQRKRRKGARRSDGHLRRRPTEGFVAGGARGTRGLTPPQPSWACEVKAGCKDDVEEGCNGCGAWMCEEHGRWDTVVDLCVGCYEEGVEDMRESTHEDS